jgi:uncharacterized Zn-finger protein
VLSKGVPMNRAEAARYFKLASIDETVAVQFLELLFRAPQKKWKHDKIYLPYFKYLTICPYHSFHYAITSTNILRIPIFASEITNNTEQSYIACHLIDPTISDFAMIIW